MSDSRMALYRVTVRGVVPSMTLLVLCDVPGLVKARAQQVIGQHITQHNQEIYDEAARNRQALVKMGAVTPGQNRDVILSQLMDSEYGVDLYIQRLCEDVSSGWVGGPYYGID